MGSLFLQDRSMLAASVFLKLVWGGKKNDAGDQKVEI